MRERRLETPLAGRERELARLIELAEAADTGAALLTGPIGIGKSRLAEGVLAALAQQGWRSVGLSATGRAGRIPYASLSELIPDTIDQLDGEDDEQAGRTVLRAVEIGLGLDDGHRVVVLIDDIASFDLPSCELLVHLAANRRLFIVATQAVGQSLPEALRRLTPAAVREVNLEPLTLPGMAELAGRHLGGPVEPGLVRALRTRTLGNPLFIRELLESGLTDGVIDLRNGVHQLAGELRIGPRLGRQLLSRLGLVSDTERTVLELLALAGTLGVEDLIPVAGIEGLEAMERQGLVASRSDRRRHRLSIGHPLHAEAIAADLTSLGRRRRFRQITDLVALHGRRRSEDRVLDCLAAVGGGQERDVDALVDAAYVALRLDRVEDARVLARAAFEASPGEATRAAHAETLIRQGRFVEADVLMAEPVPDSIDDWARMRRAIRRSSNQLWGFRDPGAALRLDEACISGLSDPTAIDRVVAHQAWIEYSDGYPLAALERTKPLVGTEHPDVRFAVAIVRAPALVLSGRVDDGAELAQRAWDLGWGTDTDHGSHGQHLIALGFAHLYEGDLSAARFIADEGIKVCRHQGEMTPLLFLLDLAATVEAVAGHLSLACSYAEEAMELGCELALASSVQAALARIVRCRAQLGDRIGAAEAWACLEEAPPAPTPHGGLERTHAQGWMMAVAGDPADGAAVLAAGARAAADRGLRVGAVLMLFDRARLGYADVTTAELAADLAGHSQGRLLPLLGRTIGPLAVGDGAALDGAAAELAELGLPLWSAEMSAAASDAWSGRGDQRAATASQRLSDETRKEVDDARTPALARRHRPDPLSRREREVAALASNGAANSEIADQLHLSIRTVETHLQRVYRKLGISSRRELANALGFETTSSE